LHPPPPPHSNRKSPNLPKFPPLPSPTGAAIPIMTYEQTTSQRPTKETQALLGGCHD
jgi:hypothetical protein